MPDKTIGAEKVKIDFLWIPPLSPNPLMPCIERGEGVCMNVTTQLLNYLEEGRKMP